MQKLPKQFKEKWVKALRSGKYKQGTASLENNGKYCCLGVAAKVCGVKNIRGQYLDNGLGGELIKIPELLHGDFIQNPIAEALAELNDNDVPFEVIAGLINENL